MRDHFSHDRETNPEREKNIERGACGFQKQYGAH